MFFVIALLAVVGAVTVLSRVIPFAVGLLARKRDLRKLYGAEWAIVTGASSGIGRAITRRLVSQGIGVVAVSLPGADADSLERERLPNVDVVRLDLASPGSISALEAHTATAGHAISLVFCNAGCGYAAPLEGIDGSWAERFLSLSVASHARVASAFYGRLVRDGRRGAIVLTSSAMAHLPASHSELYCASKAFLERFALSLAPAAAWHGVDVLAVLPGAVLDTRFWDPLPSSLSLVRLVRALGQPPGAVVDAIWRSLGRVTTVDVGALSLLASTAEAIVSPAGLSAAFAAIVQAASRFGIFSDYFNFRTGCE